MRLTRQPEVGHDRAHAPIGILGEDYVIALEISMHHLVAMRFGQSGADLARDDAAFGVRQPAAIEARGQCLTIQKLHGEKIDFTAGGGGGVDLENLADIGMADFARVPHLGRQTLAESALGALQRDAASQAFVLGLVNDAHAALRNLPHDAEAVRQQLTGLKMMLGQSRIERLQEEILRAVSYDSTGLRPSLPKIWKKSRRRCRNWCSRTFLTQGNFCLATRGWRSSRKKATS